MATLQKLDGQTFALAIRMHRERLRLTQAEAAKLCDVSPRVWWKWENQGGDTLAVTQEGVIARLKFAKPKGRKRGPKGGRREGV